MAQSTKSKPAGFDLFESLPGKPVYYYLGAYALATILLFYKTIFAFSKLVFGTDLMAGNLFFRHFYIDYFKAHGTWPLWDPYIHGGMPFMEAIHGDIFYIPSFVFYMLFGVNYAWGFLLALHVFIAGIFMYLFLKELDIRGKVAFLGGLFYMMAPVFISLVYAGHNGKIFVISLTPVLFFIFQKAIKTGRLLYFLIMSLVFFLIVASPHMQLAYFLFVTFGLYVIVKLVQLWLDQKKAPIKLILLFGLAVIIGLALSLVQFLAPYQYLKKYSMRTERTDTGKGYEYSTSWAMSWEEAAADFFPEFVGDDVGNQKQTYWGRNPFKLNSEHFSLLAIFLSILGLGLWKKRGKWFFFATAIATLLYALGDSTPFFKLFYQIPGIKSFRAPSLISFLTAFSVITLGAMGLESILEKKRDDKNIQKTWKYYTYISLAYTAIIALLIILQMNFFKIWFAIFGYTPEPQKLETLRRSLDGVAIGAVISLVFVWVLYGLLRLHLDKKVKSDMLVIVLGVMTFIYLWSYNTRYIVPIDPKQYLDKTPAVDFFKTKQAEGPFRVFVLPQTLPDYYLAYHGIEELSLTALHGNQLACHDKLAGNKGNVRGLVFQSVQDLLNAKYVVSRQQLPPQRFKEAANYGSIRIYENMTAFPRACAIYNYSVIPDEDRIVSILYDTTFDYRSRLLLESPPSGIAVNADDTTKYPLTPGIIYDITNSSFKVDIDMARDGFLFLSENYYPAWNAYENGRLLTTLKADVAFRAIPLKQGKHSIVCKFENKTFNATFTLSKITLILLILAITGLLIKEKFIDKRKSQIDT
jgi:hypothetical protein